MDELRCFLVLALPGLLLFAYLYISLNYTKRWKAVLDQGFPGDDLDLEGQLYGGEQAGAAPLLMRWYRALQSLTIPSL